MLLGVSQFDAVRFTIVGNWADQVPAAPGELSGGLRAHLVPLHVPCFAVFA